MADLTVKDLLATGVHFGHQTRRWNPKMKKFIFTERNGIYIIDLQKTLAQINKACAAIRKVAGNGDSILFVGTKPQASGILHEEAERCGQFHVVNRWAGGMLTNYRTIRQSIKKLEHFEKMATDGTYDLLTKKEIITIEKQHEKLSFMLEGIRKMSRLPGLLIVVDTRKEKIAVNEANRLKIPVCAIVDTNSDPDPITYPIPANDDAIRSIKLILGALTDAVIEGMQLHVDDAAIAAKEAAGQEKDREPRRKSGRREQASKSGPREQTHKKPSGDRKTTPKKTYPPAAPKASGAHDSPKPAKPTEAAKPTETSKPVEAAKPTETAKPAKPAKTAKNVDTAETAPAKDSGKGGAAKKDADAEGKAKPKKKPSKKAAPKKDDKPADVGPAADGADSSGADADAGKSGDQS